MPHWRAHGHQTERLFLGGLGRLRLLQQLWQHPGLRGLVRRRPPMHCLGPAWMHACKLHMVWSALHYATPHHELHARRYFKRAILVGYPSCTLYGVSGAGKPANWTTAAVFFPDTCGYLTGTSSYNTSINQVTWNLAGQATQLGSTGLSLTACAQFCISSAGCYAWTWTLVNGTSTCYSLGFVASTASTTLPAGLVVSGAASYSTLIPGTALTGGTPYSVFPAGTAAACSTTCVADSKCAGW